MPINNNFNKIINNKLPANISVNKETTKSASFHCVGVFVSMLSYILIQTARSDLLIQHADVKSRNTVSGQWN
jgi:hypothetical protein